MLRAASDFASPLGASGFVFVAVAMCINGEDRSPNR